MTLLSPTVLQYCIYRIFLAGGHGYKNCVRHYFDSSSEVARAAVEPGHKDDLTKIVGGLYYLP
jgi:hypothetical protein